MAIRILTDSASDFTHEELEKNQITCVPMTITFEDKTFVDGVTLTADEFWKRMIAGGMPKTSQPSPDAFLSEFEKAKAAGDAVVCVLISSALSGTLQSAKLAAGMIDYDQIYLVDSLSVTVCEKIVVLRACQLRDEGKLSAADIARELEAFRSRVKVFASLDTLDYLARGGRIPKAAASLGSLIQLKAQFTVGRDGLVEMTGKAIGRHRSCEALLKLFREHKIDPAFPVRPVYTCDDTNCQAFIKKLNQQGIPCLMEDAVSVGSTVSTHVGPAAFGAAFVEAE